MILTNRKRDLEQRKALNSWSINGFNGSIIAGTGFGKSRLAVLAIDYVLSKNENGKALIIVPTIQLQGQFKNEFRKWKCSNCLVNVDILCYHSAYKLQNNHYDIVVCDEIHLVLSPEYRKFFANNTYDKLLCMTATLPEDEDYKAILEDLAPINYQISLDTCVKLKLVSPYKIYCIPVELTVQEKIDYKSINNKFIYYKYQLGQFDAFNEAKRLIADKNASSHSKGMAAQFYRAIRARKAIVDFALNKISKFQELVYANLDRQILSFSGANDFTDEMCNSVKPFSAAYHSKKTKKQREQALKDFKEENISVLCSTKALNQGLDIPNADMGIICGLTSKSLSMIQRIGRLIRYKKGKVGEIYILYVKDSQEEKWLKKSVKSLDNIEWL